jgi:hypothetical protein
MSSAAAAQIDDTAGVTLESEKKSLLEVAQTIALLSTISEREHRPGRGDAVHPARQPRGWSGRT